MELEEEVSLPGRVLPEALSKEVEEEEEEPSRTLKKSYLSSVLNVEKVMERVVPGTPVSVSAQLRPLE